MAGRRTTKRKTGIVINEDELAEVAVKSVDAFVYDMMKEYGDYTLASRAIPSEEDGLMPVQRRTVWAMKQLGLSNNTAYLKHATIIGETMGRYHPHGDASIYDAGVRLANRTPAPLIQGNGNWGSYTAKPAEMRYHEARPSALTDAVLLDPYYLRAVDYVPNFDSQKMEPVVLPAKLPLALAIEQAGIALGTTTMIPAFTLESLTKVVKHMMRGGTITDAALARNLKFASRWGGVVISTPEEIASFFATGTGPITWRCAYTVQDNVIEVTGLPPMFNFDNRVVAIAEDPKLPGVISAHNMADEQYPIRLMITVKKGETQAETIRKVIDKHLTTRITYRINVVRRVINTTTIPHSVDSEFVGVSPRELLEDWLDWRLNQLERRALMAEETDLKARVERLRLVIIAVDNLEIVFQVLRGAKDMAGTLAQRLKLSLDDANTILDLATRRLGRLNKGDVEADIAKLTALRKQLRVDLKALGASALRRSKI